MEALEAVKIFFAEESNSLYLPNSRVRRDFTLDLEQQIRELSLARPLIFFSSSGTTANENHHKLVGLSAEALLCSAQAVNEFFNYQSSDIFYNVLPLFHVGGVGTYLRAKLIGADYINEDNLKWNPEHFCRQINLYRATTTSVVPTMLYDIAKGDLRAPNSLSQVVVGGGRLDSDIKIKLQKLGWPLRESYGLTECSSQVASSDDRGDLRVLPHVNLSISSDGLIQIKSKALLDGMLLIDELGTRFVDPKISEVYTTADLGTLTEGVLKVLGRADDLVKINGELISLAKLNQVWMQGLAQDKFAIIAEADLRTGNRLVLVVENDIYDQVTELKAAIESRLMPLERISEFRKIEKLPRSELGKILRGQLKGKN